MFLLVERLDALDQLGVHKDRPRSKVLQIVIAALTTALQHDPTNTTWQQELKRSQKEKAVAETLERSEGDGEGGV